MAHFETVYDVGDAVRETSGPRSKWIFRVDEIRIQRFSREGLALLLIEYRRVFETGYRARWVREQDLTLVARGSKSPSTVREMRNAKDHS